MKIKHTKYFILPSILTIIFIIFTLLVKIVDVQPVGAMGTNIGFASINTAFQKLTGVSVATGPKLFWYNITEVTGLISIASAGCMALIGLCELIKTKSIFEVDNEIVFRGIVYGIAIILYVVFEKLVINYRPIVAPGELLPEPSYPSTHTMLVCCIMGVIVIAVGRLLFNNLARHIIQSACVIIAVLTVFGRLICGVHWLTDIIGGLILGATLVSLYNALVKTFR